MINTVCLEGVSWPGPAVWAPWRHPFLYEPLGRGCPLGPFYPATSLKKAYFSLDRPVINILMLGKNMYEYVLPICSLLWCGEFSMNFFSDYYGRGCCLWTTVCFVCRVILFYVAPFQVPFLSALCSVPLIPFNSLVHVNLPPLLSTFSPYLATGRSMGSWFWFQISCSMLLQI